MRELLVGGVGCVGRYVVLCGLAFGLTGCGGLVTLQAWLGSEGPEPKADAAIVAPGPTRLSVDSTPQEAKKFALMALFAKVVYRKDLKEGVRNAEGCRYLEDGISVPDVGMPQLAGQSIGWRRWNGRLEKQAIATPCLNKDGFSMETYVHSTDGKTIDKAVIAFRGTENYSWSEKLADWSTNFSASLGLTPHEYTIAEAVVPEVINALQKANSNVEVYATGHSLGGGLAQQAGYLDARIKAVYAFDTSPVTNWSNLQWRQNRDGAACRAALLAKPLPDLRAQEEKREACKTLVIKNPYPTIYRVSHWNEGLAYVRNVTSRFNTTRFGRSDHEFFFEKDNPVAAHEMGVLACHFARLMPDDDKEFDYPKAYAVKVTSKEYGDAYDEHPICPVGVNLPAAQTQQMTAN